MSGISPVASSAMQRAAPLVHLPQVLDELGVDLETVLDGSGIAASDLRPDAFVPFAASQLVLDRAAILSGCDDIGLRIGLRQSLAALGPVAEVMRHAATLGEALGDFVALQLGNSTGAAVYLLRGPSEVAFGYGVYDYGGGVSSQLHDLVLAVACKIVSELTQGAVQPREMFSIRRRPEKLEPYRALGKSPIVFGQSQTCVYLPLASMGHELHSADRERREVMLGRLALQRTLLPGQMADRVKHALRSLLVEGRTAMPEVSRHLGLHPRSLRRALEREGTTFDAIRDQVRFAVARELLALTSLPLGDIGITIGFSTPSSFVHAFRRWTATTPAMWRKRLQVAP